MSGPISTPNILPPRLSMSEYVDFVEASLRDCDPARVARQKDLEERIRTPFRIGEDTPMGTKKVEATCGRQEENEE
jgi:hypothetical protein